MNSTTKHCEYIITKGVRKGLFCITKKCDDNGLCKKHSKSKKEIIIKEIIIKEIIIKENIIIKKKINILDLPIDILENLIIQNISKGLNIIFNNKIERIIKYNGNDYYSTFECCGKHCGETNKLKVCYGYDRFWTGMIPFKLQLKCDICIKEYNKVVCDKCSNEFDCKKMNFLSGGYDEKKILCNRCIKPYTKEIFDVNLLGKYDPKTDMCILNTPYHIQKYNKDINLKSKSLKYRLVEEQINYKNRCIDINGNIYIYKGNIYNGNK